MLLFGVLGLLAVVFGLTVQAETIYVSLDAPEANTGTNLDWTAVAIDLSGNPRRDLAYRQVDIGCYEYVFRLGTVMIIQ